MRRFCIILLFFIFLLTSLSAQNLSVSSFRPLETDLTANTHGTMETDQNGETAALIKVVTTQKDFTFEAGMLGIVKTRQNVGEIWVYVPKGSRKITIKHPQLGVLRDWNYPCTIEAGRTYEMVLVSGEVVTSVVKDKGGNMLAVSVTPANSSLYINDGQKMLNNGQHTQFYPYGEYTYRVESPGYMPDAGSFRIEASQKTVLKIDLKSALATLTVECPTEGCEIYVNESKKGTDSYTEDVIDGMYLIEVRKVGYRSHQETVTLGKQERCTVSVPSLTPVYGSLMVNVQPVDADIFIDGVKRGTSPEIIEDILIGEHTVKVSLSGYKDLVRQIEIREGEQSSLSGELEKAVSSAVNATSSATSSSNSATGAINGHEYVDLGLPSGTLWATCNVGASSPSDYGDYYAWGETRTKSIYDWKNLRYRTSGDSYYNVTFSKYVKSTHGMVDNKTQLELSDDAANSNWGGSWRMPTRDEWVELKNNCTWTWTSQGGHWGYEIKSKKNGNSIFLPASGWRSGDGLSSVGEYGYYWSSSLRADYSYTACICYFYSSSVDPSRSSFRYDGQSVRPVSSSL